MEQNNRNVSKYIGEWTQRRTTPCNARALERNGWKAAQWESHRLWRYLEDLQMQCLGTSSSGGLGSVRFTVGFSNLQGLFQLKFYDARKHAERSQSSTIRLAGRINDYLSVFPAANP